MFWHWFQGDEGLFPLVFGHNWSHLKAFILYGAYHKVVKNITAPIEVKIVTKVKTVQLCKKVDLVVSDVLCTPTIVHVCLLFLEEYWIHQFRCAQVPFGIATVGCWSEGMCNRLSTTVRCPAMLSTCLLNSFLGARRSGRVSWSPAKDHQHLWCGAHLSLAQCQIFSGLAKLFFSFEPLHLSWTSKIKSSYE